MQVALHARTSRLRCAYCHDVAEVGQAAKHCPRCRTVVHIDCWGAVGCPTHGCKRPVRIRWLSRAPAERRTDETFLARLLYPMMVVGAMALVAVLTVVVASLPFVL